MYSQSIFTKSPKFESVRQILMDLSFKLMKSVLILRAPVKVSQYDALSEFLMEFYMETGHLQSFCSASAIFGLEQRCHVRLFGSSTAALRPAQKVGAVSGAEPGGHG